MKHFPLAVVLGCSLYALGFWLFGTMGKLPWDEASSIVRQGYKPHDAITTRPWWAAKARQWLGDLSFLQVRDLEHEDLSHFTRLWVISLPGHYHLGGPFIDGTYTMVNQVDLDGLLVELWKLPEPVEVLYDFRENLNQARVFVAARTGDKPCSRWVRDRWICTGRDWNYVGRVIVEMGDDPREVIWAHPSDLGTLVISYAQVPTGKTLLVHTGLTPPGARTPNGSPVHLDLELDGKLLGTIMQPNQTGYFPHSFDISNAGPGQHRVVFKVHADNIGMRHFCFQAEVVR